MGLEVHIARLMAKSVPCAYYEHRLRWLAMWRLVGLACAGHWWIQINHDPGDEDRG